MEKVACRVYDGGGGGLGSRNSVIGRVVSSLSASIRRRLDFRGLMTHPALPPPAPTRKMKEGNESECVQYKQVLQAPVS